jgi:hypothetical protein
MTEIEPKVTSVRENDVLKHRQALDNSVAEMEKETSTSSKGAFSIATFGLYKNKTKQKFTSPLSFSSLPPQSSLPSLPCTQTFPSKLCGSSFARPKPVCPPLLLPPYVPYPTTRGAFIESLTPSSGTSDAITKRVTRWKENRAASQLQVNPQHTPSAPTIPTVFLPKNVKRHRNGPK